MKVHDAGVSVIRVSAADRTTASDYAVSIGTGLLGRLGEIARTAAPAVLYAIIADDRVAALHGAAACAALQGVGRVELLTFPAGEQSKTRETWIRLTDALLELGIGRDGCVIALGGGVTGDLAGFVAATCLRGVALIQVPTSLLAMIDASIGGKTGVDVPAGKNLVGAFHAPRAVVIDPALLRTLPDAELRAGLAEAIKHGAIADAAYLDRIAAEAAALIDRDETALRELVRRSVEIKAEVVAGDPLERGRRAILNFGHTVAHAIERASRYAVPHGLAVAMGIVAEARIGETIGVTETGTAERIAYALRAVGLPLEPPAGLDAADIVAATRGDKKSRGERVRYALLARAGEAARAPDGSWTVAVEDATVLETLRTRRP